MNVLNSKRAFTLVELIIVIAIIGVLAAILIPTFATVIEKANKKSALSDAKNALQLTIAELTDAAGGLTIGEGSVFKVRKADKNWFYTYFNNALHEGSGAENSNPLRPIDRPTGSIIYMAEDCFYKSEKDATAVIIPTLPKTVIIYNTHTDAQYTPPANEADSDRDGYLLIKGAADFTSEFFAANGLSAKYKLANDIVLSGDFEPITSVLTGELDGNGKTIKNLSIDKPDGEGIGLFVEFNGNVHDLTIEVTNIYAKAKLGALCGTISGGSVSNVHVKMTGMISNLVEEVGIHEDRAYSGGICGIANNASITKCSVNGWLNSSVYSGGIVGKATNTTISRSSFEGDIEASACLIEDCSANGSYQRGAMYRLGGICAHPMDNTEIKHCISICTYLALNYPAFENINACTIGPICASHPDETDYTVTESYYLENDYLLGLEPSHCYAGNSISSWSEASGLSADVWDLSGMVPCLK